MPGRDHHNSNISNNSNNSNNNKNNGDQAKLHQPNVATSCRPTHTHHDDDKIEGTRPRNPCAPAPGNDGGSPARARITPHPAKNSSGLLAMATSTPSTLHLAWNSMASPLEALVRKEVATLEMEEDMAAATSSSSYT